MRAAALALLVACRPERATPPPDTGPVSLVTTLEGFGGGSTGGEVLGHAERVVTSLADDGPGSLREALGLGGPAVITFGVEGDLELASPVAVPSEVTLSGRGRDVTIRGNGLWLDGVHDVRVEDLSFRDVRGPGDAIAITNGAARIAVLHATFSNAGLAADVPDEMISVTWGATDVTIAWCRFEDTDKVLLFGNGDAPAEVDGEIAVTLHDDVFLRNGRRHPFLRHGRVDAYNLLIEDWQLRHDKTYGVRAAEGGRIRLESSRFTQHGEGSLALPPDLAVALHGSPWLGAVSQGSGVVEPIGVVVNDPRIVIEDGGASFERPYAATLQPPTDGWRAAMLELAGDTR